MIGTRFLTLAAFLSCGTTQAATSTEIEAVFVKAMKKGANAVYHERCTGAGTSWGGIVSDDNSAAGLLKIVGMLTAQAVIRDKSDRDGCSAGLLPGQERYFEIYPDGTVKKY